MSDHFLKNVERWAVFCPVEAKKLLDTSAEWEVKPFDQQEADLLLEESKLAVQRMGTRDLEVIYVYGVGIGSMYDALELWLKEAPTHHLVFFEADLDVIKRLFHTQKGSDILHDPRVWLYYLDGEGKVFDTVTTLFVLRRYRQLALQRDIDKDPVIFQQNHAKLDFLTNLKQLSLDEYLHFGWGYFQNFFRNILLLPEAHPASCMYGRFKNVPAIICGAGPSLKKNLHVLEGLKDRALIFAGGTAMNAVNANGFVPHFGVGIDPNKDQFTRLITNIAFETPYFYRNRLVHEGLALIHGEHLYVPGSGGYGITRWLEKELGIQGEDITEGCNVINFSVSIAAILGCNPIICVGVDLAYSDEQPYAPGIVNHPLHSRREHFKTKNSQEELIVRPDIHGNPVYTLWKWMMESFWFTTFATHHSQLKFINATEGGLGFVAVPNMALQEVADKYLPKACDLVGLVHAEIQRAQMPAGVTREVIDARMDEICKSLERCAEFVGTIHAELREHALQLQKGTPIPQEMLTKKAKENQNLLREEVAYINFLKVFDEAFTRATAMESLRLAIDKDLLGPEKRQEQKLILLARRYQFLSNTVTANVKHLKKAVGEAIAQTKHLVSMAADYHPPAQPTIKGEDAASIDLAEAGVEKHDNHDAKGHLYSSYHTKNGLLHGPFVYYGESGSVSSKTFYVDGQRQAHALFYYPNGHIASIQRFKDDVWEGNQEHYYLDGTLKAHIPYQKGRLHGEVRLYDRFGRQSRQVAFVNGKRDGLELVWNEKGVLIIEAAFKEDRPLDKARMWHDNGTLASEILFDEEGHALSLRKWDTKGALYAVEDDLEDDYFDKVTKQTGVLTSSLDGVVSQLVTVAPILAHTIHGEEGKEAFSDIQKDLLSLQEEMAHLKEISQQLVQESGMNPAMHKEPLWKSPTSRRELELQVEEKANVMAKDLSSTQQLLAKTLEAITKRLGN